MHLCKKETTMTVRSNLTIKNLDQFLTRLGKQLSIFAGAVEPSRFKVAMKIRKVKLLRQ